MVSSKFTALNMVNVADFQSHGSVTVDTLPAVTLPDFEPRRVPNFYRLSFSWHPCFTIPGCSEPHKATLGPTELYHTALCRVVSIKNKGDCPCDASLIYTMPLYSDPHRTTPYQSELGLSMSIKNESDYPRPTLLCLAAPRLTSLCFTGPDHTSPCEAPLGYASSIVNYKRLDCKTAHADCTTVANTTQFTSINQHCFHFTTTDNSLVPQDRELTRPTFGATHAVTNIARLRGRIANAANVEVNRRIGVGGRSFDLHNIKVVAVGESRPKAVNQDFVIHDLQSCGNVVLNTASAFFGIPRAVAHCGENVRRIYEQLTRLCNVDGLAPLGRVIACYAVSFLLFERHSVRPEFVMKHRARSNNLDFGGYDICTHAVPNLSALGRTKLNSSEHIKTAPDSTQPYGQGLQANHRAPAFVFTCRRRRRLAETRRFTDKQKRPIAFDMNSLAQIKMDVNR